MAYQITSLTIVYLIVHSSAGQRKHQSSSSLAFVRGIHRRPVNSPHSPETGEFPAHMASNAEDVSIWWPHHVLVTEIEHMSSGCRMLCFTSLVNTRWMASLWLRHGCCWQAGDGGYCIRHPSKMLTMCWLLSRGCAHLRKWYHFIILNDWLG